VTLPLEDALQHLDGIKHIISINSAGLSQIQVEIKDSYDKHRSPQVFDDFGDVYGILLNLSGQDFSNRELSNYSDYLPRELVLVPGGKKVSVVGDVTEQVVIEISQQKLSALGLDQSYIYGLVNHQNVVSNAGSIVIGDNRIRLHPTGEFSSVAELSRLVVSSPDSTEFIYLGDIVDIEKDYDATPRVLYHNKGEAALSLGIAFSSGVKVVDVGQRVSDRLVELESQRPLGMSLDTVYNQSQAVDDTVQGFLISLLESIAIVIAVLLLFMGLRSGLLIGLILLLTILGTFIVMKVLNIALQSISLGALIIAYVGRQRYCRDRRHFDLFTTR
jgi:multidrug efflux pump subunit AcrB